MPEQQEIEKQKEAVEAEQKKYERRLLMVLHMSLSSGLGVKDAAEKVAKHTGEDPDCIRVDWYRRHLWGRQFFHLDDPASMLIDVLIELRGIKLACDMEARRMEPQKELERDLDGSVVRDNNGNPVFRVLDDKHHKERMFARRMKMSVIEMEANVLRELKFIPKLPDGLPYSWDKSSGNFGKLNIDEIQHGIADMQDRLKGLTTGEGWVDIREIKEEDTKKE